MIKKTHKNSILQATLLSDNKTTSPFELPQALPSFIGVGQPIHVEPNSEFQERVVVEPLEQSSPSMTKHLRQHHIL